MINDDTHDQLVKEYLEYFKANEAFMASPSELKRRTARKHLSNIRQLAKIRRKEIIDHHVDKSRWNKAGLDPKKAREAKNKNN
jgi:hypothetical protein|tara:strand:- start:259 stop:507 length:249 start_codon:yes stop_codon:yes gene_type:complete